MTRIIFHCLKYLFKYDYLKIYYYCQYLIIHNNLYNMYIKICFNFY